MLTLNAAHAADYNSAYTSLNRCPPTDRITFKREKSISEQCPAKGDFNIFIEGDTEETLKFVLEHDFNAMIADDPHARRIRISNTTGGDDYLSGEITGQRVEWLYRETPQGTQFTGIVLKRLVDSRKQYEAFRWVDAGYFCHIGGDLDDAKARQLLESGKACP